MTLFELSKKAILILVFLVLLASLIGMPLLVSGESMMPNFASGEVVIVEQISYSGKGNIRRGDVVAAKFPADAKQTRLIKRVIGLPGETVTVSNGQIAINGTALNEQNYQPIIGIPPYSELASVALKEGEYFLAGDNRPGSSDSRLWGPVIRQDILGKVSFTLWPINTIRFVERGQY